MLLQAFFSIRSERQLTGQINYNLLFRWFVGFDIGAAVRDAITLSKNGDRRLEADVARRIGFGWRDRVTEYAAQHSAHPL